MGVKVGTETKGGKMIQKLILIAVLLLGVSVSEAQTKSGKAKGKSGETRPTLSAGADNFYRKLGLTAAEEKKLFAIKKRHRDATREATRKPLGERSEARAKAAKILDELKALLGEDRYARYRAGQLKTKDSQRGRVRELKRIAAERTAKLKADRAASREAAKKKR